MVDNMNKASLGIKQDILKLKCPFTLNATTFVLLVSHAVLGIPQPQIIPQPIGTRTDYMICDWVSLDTHHRL